MSNDDDAKDKEISEKKLNANRENAKKSTGAKTELGKAKSRSNAIIHGIYAKYIHANAIPFLESRAELRSILDGLRSDWRPDGTDEKLQVEKLAWVNLSQIRLVRGETAALNVRLAAAVAEAKERVRDEAWITNEDGIRIGPFRLRIDIDAVTDQDVEDQFALFARIKAGDVSLIDEADFLIFVHTNRFPSGDGQSELSDAELAGCRQFVVGLDQEARTELENRFESLVSLGLKKMIEIRSKKIAEHAAIEMAFLPDDSTLAKIVKWSAHLGREERRIVDRLEKLQAARHGKKCP